MNQALNYQGVTRKAGQVVPFPQRSHHERPSGAAKTVATRGQSKSGVKRRKNGKGLGTTKSAQWIGSPQRLFPLKQAAAYLGRSPRGMRELEWSGRIPAVRDGKKIYFDIQDLNAYVERNKATCTN